MIPRKSVLCVCDLISYYLHHITNNITAHIKQYIIKKYKGRLILSKSKSAKSQEDYIAEEHENPYIRITPRFS